MWQQAYLSNKASWGKIISTEDEMFSPSPLSEANQIHEHRATIYFIM